MGLPNNLRAAMAIEGQMLAAGCWEVEVELNVLVHFPLWRPFWKLYQLYHYTFLANPAGLAWWP